MKLKQSRYNFLYDVADDNSTIIYNSRTGALAVIDSEHSDMLKQFIYNNIDIYDEIFLKQLIECGFLVPYDTDETYLLKLNLFKERYNTQKMYLTIAPTMACNFRCIYCFEQGHYGKECMNPTTLKSLITFIQKHLPELKSLHINWFGGEPLLAMPVIQEISLEVIKLCERYSVDYDASVITNGYLYTKSIANQLKKLKVKKVQITLDGPKEVHDVRRPLINGGTTYDTIIKNLLETNGIIPIQLRINVDKDSISSVKEFMSYLKQNNLLETITPYLGFVLPYGDVYQSEKCFTTELYSNINLQFWKENKIPFQSMYPAPRANYCMADYYNGWVIDDKGFIYKCWNEIGIQDRSLGNINNDIILENTEIIKDFLDFDPTLNSECKECKVLPICMGGCMYNRRNNLEKCEQRKYNMKEYILECVQAIR